jgi:hypothetical protein
MQFHSMSADNQWERSNTFKLSADFGSHTQLLEAKKKARDIEERRIYSARTNRTGFLGAPTGCYESFSR